MQDSDNIYQSFMCNLVKNTLILIQHFYAKEGLKITYFIKSE